VLGLKVVLHDGELVCTGNMANPHSDGYYERYTASSDLTGLFIGSEGILGIIVEIGLKIERLAPAIGHAEYHFDNIENAADAIYRTRLERVPANIMSIAEGVSMDRMNPAGAPHPDAARWIRIEGNSEEAIAVELAKIDEIATGLGGKYIGPESGERFWENKWRAGAISGQGGYRGMRTHNHVVFPFKGLGKVLKDLRKFSNELEKKYGMDINISPAHYSTRCAVVVTNVVFNDEDPEERKLALEMTDALKLPQLEMGGTPIRIARYWGDYVGEFGNRFPVLKKLKKALDPNGIMAPGMWGG